ncbi:MAG: AAA family ATPase [Candidatus Bathyarchaeia archaeon]
MIKGLLLENFMSYKNAYVSFKDGLNIICGPNGSGKSSILLAISIVLGQTYTERAKRLSDLIRYGEDEARITLILDNSIKNGKRPFSSFYKNDLKITRVIKKNGDYYYLMDGKPVNKNAITYAFNKVGLNPNNMLVIMHQLMVGKFSLTSPQEKLKMLENAVGFQSYREDVIDTKRRLEKMFTEEHSIFKMLNSTKETYEFWKKEYEKFLYKKELELKLNELKKELLFVKIKKKEIKLKKLDEKIKEKEIAIKKLSEDLIKFNQNLSEVQKRFESLKNKLKNLIEERKILYEFVISIKERFNKVEDGIEPILVDSSLKALSNLFQKLIEYKELELNEFEKTISELIKTKVSIEVLLMKKELLSEGLKNLKKNYRIINEELKPLLLEANKLRLDFKAQVHERNIIEIMNEMSITEERLKPLAHISSDVKKMYSSYANLYEKLSEKAETLKKNKKKLEEELKKRLEKWKQVINEFLKNLSYRYNSILAEIGASGEIKLVESNDIEKAGIEILVGFKGLKPRSLDSLTQSGGERSIALMAFLLALQQNIISPFRAIDEFDVHMDPRNREIISRLIIANTKSWFEGQYIVITPGQIHIPDENVHVIVVQTTNGYSTLYEVNE